MYFRLLIPPSKETLAPIPAECTEDHESHTIEIDLLLKGGLA